MANRRYRSQFRFSFHKDIVDIFAHVSFGASGAPTLDAVNSPGIVSVTRNSAGNYTFVFGTNSQLALDTYNYLLMAKACFVDPSAAPAAPGFYVSNNSISTSGVASITVQFNAAGTPTDPASGENVLIEFTLRNSSVPL
jgi:hypothetical protein